MKLTALKVSKGTLSPHYLAFALFGPICIMLGVGLAPSINWFHAGLLCVSVYLTYSIAHVVHDLGHATPEYITLSRRGLKILAVVLAVISAGFIAYFSLTVSLWTLAFAATIPLCVLYRKGLIYSPFAFSGGCFVCVLGGYFIMTKTIALGPVMMALFAALLLHAALMLYKIDEWTKKTAGVVETDCISKADYNRVVNYLIVIFLSLIPLVIALLLR